MIDPQERQLTAEREHALLRAAIDNMAQGIAMHNADRKLVSRNRLFIEYLEMPDQAPQPSRASRRRSSSESVSKPMAGSRSFSAARSRP